MADLLTEAVDRVIEGAPPEEMVAGRPGPGNPLGLPEVPAPPKENDKSAEQEEAAEPPVGPGAVAVGTGIGVIDILDADPQADGDGGLDEDKF